MVGENTDKTKLLDEIMAVEDWRHPFDFGEGRALALERRDLGPWQLYRANLSRRAIEGVMDVNNISILDLACNDGYFSFQWADKAKRAVGLDVRDECIRRANLVKKYYGYTNYDFKQADLRSYDLEREWGKNAFELVLCYGILYHVTDPYDFLKRIFKVTKNTLALFTFLDHSERPVLVLTKEDVAKPGSGVDPIVTRPSHHAVVRLLYGVGFDLALRYIPHKISFYNHLECGHFFGIKLDGVKAEEYIRTHNVRTKYNRLIKKDQLILCEDVWGINGVKRIGALTSFKPSMHQHLIQRVRRYLAQK